MSAMGRNGDATRAAGLGGKLTLAAETLLGAWTFIWPVGFRAFEPMRLAREQGTGRQS